MLSQERAASGQFTEEVGHSALLADQKQQHFCNLL
jgi:hypothetical protein